MSLVQATLFPDPDPREALEAIERRLPNKDWLTVADLSCAFNRSLNTVYAWIEEGRVLVMNSGTGALRGSYQIFRPSVINMAKAMLGIPQQKEKS